MLVMYCWRSLNYLMASLVIIGALLSCVSVSASELRGLPRSKLPLYDPSKPFTCLDSSAVIPWTKVNDDYCDCRDGSDEPGTSACSNGHFFCRNKGHKAKFVLSSRVNDGICDCCDGSDEYDSWIKCDNTCWEDGKAAREDADRKRQLLEEGHKIYGVWIKDVEANLAQRKKRLEEVNAELDQLSPKRTEMETETKAAEEVANNAKSEHRKAWEEGKDRRQAERIFNELDTDKDGRITLGDMQTHTEFDVNADGSVTHDELKEYTEGLEEADFATFLEKVWPNIKSVYKSPAPPTAEPPPATESPTEGGTDELPPIPEHPIPPPAVESDPEPEYEPETKELIEKAEKLRSEFNTFDGKVSTLTNERSDLEKVITGDVGPGNAFFPLADSRDCFEYNDREYTYKLCPFRDIEQIQKSGGGTTSLGHYTGWVGAEGDEDRYSAQYYKDGQGCWNGPNRSTKVTIVCGPKNEVLSASEPSRCEYIMEFATPAACSIKPSAPTEEVDHDEL